MVTVLPGHALHEKGFQGQKGVGTLVSNQERRAAVVPRINCGSTARCVPPSVRDFLCPCPPRGSQDTCPRCPGEQDGRLFPGRTDRSASRTAWPCADRSASRTARLCSAPPPRRRTPPRPDPPVVCSGFGLDKFPGHALHEEGLQRQKGVGPLVSSQEQKSARGLPLINRR